MRICERITYRETASDLRPAVVAGGLVTGCSNSGDEDREQGKAEDQGGTKHRCWLRGFVKGGEAGG